MYPGKTHYRGYDIKTVKTFTNSLGTNFHGQVKISYSEGKFITIMYESLFSSFLNLS